MKNNFRLISALIIGNIIEWYGFTIFVQFLPLFMNHLFQNQNLIFVRFMDSILFAAAFVLRPIGGVLFGHLGDHYGRVDTLIISVISILVPTFCFGLLPMNTHHAEAIAILIIILRLMQGVSAGGEFPSAISYAVEKAPSKWRGFYGSLPFAGAFLGMLLAEMS